MQDNPTEWHGKLFWYIIKHDDVSREPLLTAPVNFLLGVILAISHPEYARYVISNMPDQTYQEGIKAAHRIVEDNPIERIEDVNDTDNISNRTE